jgi:2-hydroxy-6-oxonona-2,4-dienedioate hydrolase
MNLERYRDREKSWWAHCGVTPTESWLELERPAAKVRLLTAGQGEPVLLLHGGPNAGATFAPLAAHLAGRRLLIVDRPGCGLSPAVDYTHQPVDALMVELLAAILDALGLSRVDIVASSFGGACGFWFALKHPHRVSHLVQLGCPAFLSAMRPSFFLKLLATPGLGYLAARAPLSRGAAQGMFASMGHSRPLPEAFFDWYLSLAGDTGTMASERELIRNALTFRGMRPELVLSDEALAGMDVPTFFYFGAKDPFCAPADVEALAGRMKRARFHLVEGGHLPWLDAPAQAAQQTQAFLRQ